MILLELKAPVTQTYSLTPHRPLPAHDPPVAGGLGAGGFDAGGLGAPVR